MLPALLHVLGHRGFCPENFHSEKKNNVTKHIWLNIILYQEEMVKQCVLSQWHNDHFIKLINVICYIRLRIFYIT